jgi:hypothetical protein
MKVHEPEREGEQNSRCQLTKPFLTIMKVRASSQNHEGEMLFRSPLHKIKPAQTPYPSIAASNEISVLNEVA